jgi:hypothetical protein
MAVMTIPQVKQARQQAYDALRRHSYDPNLQIASKEQFVRVATDVFSDMAHERPGMIGLHVYNGTGGMFVALLERIKDDALRNAIIREVNTDASDASHPRGENRFPAKLTAGATSMMVLRSECTTLDISELGRIASGHTKYTDPASYPDFMKSPAARGLYLGSRFARN